MPKGFIIAAPASGCGKTTIALGLMATLARRGIEVAPFKIGPDFIDPGHHRHVTGRISRNLDGWMLSPAANARIFHDHLRENQVAVVEGVMGLFDGYDGRSEAGSTAQMAKWLGLPVLLVVDARSMARSAAALVQGFERFDPAVRFMGVVFNRIGSPRHLQYLTEALADQVAMPCLGGIPREPHIRMPERHLGLVTAEDHPLDTAHMDRLVGLIEGHLDVDRLIGSLQTIRPTTDGQSSNAPVVEGRPRIGIARDRAFCFYYPENLEMLATSGADLVYFSPVDDPLPPDGLDGLYLGGGYPEMVAAKLADNQGMRAAIRTWSDDGMPIYAECGGFMYLCRQLVDRDGQAHAMTGCFPHTTRMLDRRKALGYREIELAADSVFGPCGARARGHEFHYSEIETSGIEAGLDAVYKVASRSGETMPTEGCFRRQTLGSYIHLHFGSNPDLARGFVRSCHAYQSKRILFMKPSEIEALSFRIIDEEAGPHSYNDAEWSVIRRMIHTSADFEYMHTIRIHPRAIAVGIDALRRGRNIVTDTNMARAGIRKSEIDRFGGSVECLIDDSTVVQMAKESGCTRAMAAVDAAVPLMKGGIYVIGNAPTALLRLIELMRSGKAEPVLVVGLPVGFVNAAESKSELEHMEVPHITNVGRKGGSNVAASIINALAIMADA